MHNLYKKLARLRDHFRKRRPHSSEEDYCQWRKEKHWLDLQYHADGQIKKPDDLEFEILDPPSPIDPELLNRIQGSLIGMALGDALGAHVEFRPYEYLVEHPVKDLEGGGTWGLMKGQFTDDTSMALCLANSLIIRRGFVPYDQLVRYKWWSDHGYMSSTGQCFDIGRSTDDSIREFHRRQIKFARRHHLSVDALDYLSERNLIEAFKVDCSKKNAAGNGALMRLAPVPLFFHKYYQEAVDYSGYSGFITHGDEKAYDACRYFGALIYAALNGYKKDEILSNDFYDKHRPWFTAKVLCPEIQRVAEGSFKRDGGHQDGIRGGGYIVHALEAALWAFWSDENSFEKGVLLAVNLGDDTDTTAAIYGQLAGAYYGYLALPKKWIEHIYAKKFILNLSKWIAHEGENWSCKDDIIKERFPTFALTRLNSVEIVPPGRTNPRECQDRTRIMAPLTAPAKRRRRPENKAMFQDDLALVERPSMMMRKKFSSMDCLDNDSKYVDHRVVPIQTPLILRKNQRQKPVT